MHPLWILLVGVTIVVGGVLLLRLHAFLALTLAALAVGILTPTRATELYLARQTAWELLPREAGEPLVLRYEKKRGIAWKGARLLAFRTHRSQAPQFVAEFQIESVQAKDKYLLAEAEVIWHSRTGPPEQSEFSEGFDPKRYLVLEPQTWFAAQKAATQTVGERVADAFGSTCASIGILIAMAAIIGKCLLDSGAADKIVRAALKVLGERGAPLAFVGSGFLLGIPVFFDTVFYLMMPLGKAMRMRTGRNYLLYILSIVGGATMAHSLVPPTPGPLLVADELGVDLGVMIVGGCMVGFFTSGAALLYALWVNKRAEVPLRESPDFSLEELAAITQRSEKELPSLWLSLAPIVLPVVLIAGYTVVNMLDLGWDDTTMNLLATLGNKNIALTLAAIVAMGTLVWVRRTTLADLAKSVQSALASGGVIILITAAGGAFGGMLKQTGVADLIGELSPGSPAMVILLAFLITTAVRTAQGSATVAMITAVGILAGFASPDILGCHPVYLALAIGCGSKPVAWMNDSGFWVICKMSGMTEAEGLKFVTPMSILMGVVGVVVIMIAATLFPLA